MADQILLVFNASLIEHKENNHAVRVKQLILC